MKITNREKEIIQLVADELTTKEIAAHLYISDETVTTHRRNLMEKLQAKNAAGLIRRGFESGLLRLTMSLLILIQCNLSSFAQDLPLAIETDTSHAVRMGASIGQSGNKLYWNPKKSQFLTGTDHFLIGVSWNLNKIGTYATTFGALNTPDGDYSMIWGQQNVVEESAPYGTAFGASNTVDTSFGTVWGANNSLYAEYATAWGGGNIVASSYATAMGVGNIAEGYSSLVVGHYNDPILGINQSAFFDPTPAFIVGNGSDGANRSNAFTVFGSGLVKIGNGFSNADLHIKQSQTEPDGGTGGIILEHDNLNDYWQIHHSGLYLSFSKDGERIGYISDTGSYIDDENFAPENQPVTKSLSSTSFDISKVQIGTSSIKKNKKEVKINASQFLKDYPDMVIYDENGKPFGIDYRQLYLTAISTIQDQIVANESQNDQIENLKKEIQHLKKAIQAE